MPIYPCPSLFAHPSFSSYSSVFRILDIAALFHRSPLPSLCFGSSRCFSTAPRRFAQPPNGCGQHRRPGQHRGDGRYMTTITEASQKFNMVICPRNMLHDFGMKKYASGGKIKEDAERAGNASFCTPMAEMQKQATLGGCTQRKSRRDVSAVLGGTQAT